MQTGGGACYAGCEGETRNVRLEGSGALEVRRRGLWGGRGSGGHWALGSGEGAAPGRRRARDRRQTDGGRARAAGGGGGGGEGEGEGEDGGMARAGEGVGDGAWEVRLQDAHPR